MKIISGGQTGVDRAALDVAMAQGIPCGGWCPAGRLDEYGRIPDRYPVTELPDGDFAARSRQNVLDADATVIFHSGELRGGTEFTRQCCIEQKRPYLLVDASKTSSQTAAKLLVDFVEAQAVESLNVAGPRETEWQEGHEYAVAVLQPWLQLLV
jgi:predicted Rossmann fold nucleotide-binding protein DprA/Smf involved in DNA uptake